MIRWKSDAPQVFPVHRQYPLLAVGLAALTLYMGYIYGQTRDSGLLVMALICGGLTLWHVQWAGARVHCDAEKLILHRTGRPEFSLQWHQVHRLTLAGRLTRSVLVEYGDPAAPESLLLPKLQEQEAWLEAVAGSPTGNSCRSTSSDTCT